MIQNQRFSRLVALTEAEKVARTLFGGAAKVGRTPLRDSSLMAMVPFLTLEARAKSSGDAASALEQCDPRVYEVILFGSAATEVEEVHDIDMMLLDSGFYSWSFLQQIDFASDSSKTEYLRSSFVQLLSDTMYPDMTDEELRRMMPDVPCDLHLYPFTVVTDKTEREEIERKHKDPQFFDNAFRTMMRFDGDVDHFVPINLDQLCDRLVHRQDECEV